ncbi:hypothetical protein C3L33_14548, partial [Rhododendron williamsianum]
MSELLKGSGVFPVYFDSDFKNLKSLEICGGGLTDAGVKNIKDLSSLTVLNLSQNSNLTDKCLEMISGIFLKLTSPSFLDGLRETWDDTIGFFERFKLSHNRCGVAVPQATKESEIAYIGLMQGDCK